MCPVPDRLVTITPVRELETVSRESPWVLLDVTPKILFTDESTVPIQSLTFFFVECLDFFLDHDGHLSRRGSSPESPRRHSGFRRNTISRFPWENIQGADSPIFGS